MGCPYGKLWGSILFLSLYNESNTTSRIAKNSIEKHRLGVICLNLLGFQKKEQKFTFCLRFETMSSSSPTGSQPSVLFHPHFLGVQKLSPLFIVLLQTSSDQLERFHSSEVFFCISPAVWLQAGTLTSHTCGEMAANTTMSMMTKSNVISNRGLRVTFWPQRAMPTLNNYIVYWNAF